jgi:hypothetical protein
VSVTFTHPVGDGIQSAIIKATKPADVPAASHADSQPTAAGRALPLVDQQGCC